MPNRSSPGRGFRLRHWDFGFPSSLDIRHSSFTPERLHRIDSRRSSRGKPARQQRGQSKEERNANECFWVTCRHAKALTGQDAGSPKPTQDSRQDANHHGSHAIADDKIEHVARLRTESGANGNLPCPLANSASNDAVNADGGQSKGDRGERAQQHRLKASRPQRERNHLFHRSQIMDRQIFVGGGDFFYYGCFDGFWRCRSSDYQKGFSGRPKLKPAAAIPGSASRRSIKSFTNAGLLSSVGNLDEVKERFITSKPCGW